MGNPSSELDQPIRYRDRASGKILTEKVYGEAWLRWAYANPLGRITVRLAAARPWFSHWYGWRMRRPASRKRIQPFIDTYAVDPGECLRAPEDFPSFDAFFSRHLKPEARPINTDPASAVFPADGRHLGFAQASDADQVFVKGQRWDLAALLQDGELARRYQRGSLILSRLCPVDYHRFHFPVAGVPGGPRQAPRLIPGPLCSVSPIALRRKLGILWENKRQITLHHAGDFGTVVLIEIGATCVGSIIQTHVPGQQVDKGGEKGYFRFGGSSTITLFEPGKITLAQDLLSSTREGLELYARMGEPLGTLTR